MIETSDGAVLHHIDIGEGPVLLFVSSWALDSRMWDYQIAHFAERGYRCVAFDRRGHGRSSVPSAGYDMDRFADDLDGVMRSLDLRDVTVIAHSMGAAETIRYAARHGTERITRVIMLGPVAPFVLLTDDNPFGAPLEFFEHTLARYGSDLPAWAYEMQQGFFAPDTSPALKEHFTRQLLEISPIVAIRCFRALFSTDLRPDLAALNRPVLILHGALDMQAPLVATGERLQAGLPGAELKVFPTAAHGIWVTHLSEVNANIEKFIRG